MDSLGLAVAVVGKAAVAAVDMAVALAAAVGRDGLAADTASVAHKPAVLEADTSVRRVPYSPLAPAQDSRSPAELLGQRLYEWREDL